MQMGEFLASETKAEFYKTARGAIIKVRVELGKMATIDRQHHPLQKSNLAACARDTPRAAVGRCRASTDRYNGLYINGN